jgi:hypothetical protein
MSPQSTVLTWDKLRSLASSSITSSYQVLGTSFTHGARILKILNNSTQDVTISIDGTNNYDYVPAGGFTLYDCCTNRGNPSPSMDIPQGTQIYVKGTAGTGNVYVIVLYAYTPSNTIGDT